MTPSQIFLYLCLSFAGGIFINSLIYIPQLLFLGLLVLGVFLISVFWKYKKIAIAGFCVLFLAAGVFRHQWAESHILKTALTTHNDKEETFIFTGIIAEEPDIREKIQRLVIKDIYFLKEGITENGSLRADGGKVLVTTWRYPEYKYGDKLEIIGQLKTPETFEGFNYREYLQKEGIYSVMDWPKIEVVGDNFGNPFMKILFSFKNKFKETARTFISPPKEGILEALVFGDESGISGEWKEKLNISGTRHIAAVSGMNTTIIASLILSFALGLGLWRNQAFYLSVFLLVVYILMIGAPASAVRAGIMAAILIAGQYFGRISLASRAIIAAATIMIFFNPLILKLDVGFQLSFLAILGIVYFQPSFLRWLKTIPNPKIFPARTTLSSTFAAQIFTLPILIFNFGYISLVSPITNILIVPFLAPATILIFIFGGAGMIFYPLGFILSLPAGLFLTYITSVIDWFSKMPFAYLNIENIPALGRVLTFGAVSGGVNWTWLAVFYSVLAYFAWKLNKRNKYIQF